MADPHISDPPLGPPLRISVVIPQTMGPPPRPTDDHDAPQRRSSRRSLASRLPRTSSQDPEGIVPSQHSSSRTQSSSSHKRKFSEGNSSRISSLLTLGTDFSSSTKRKVEREYGEDGGCWHCGLKGSIETAHVLGASMKQVGLPISSPLARRSTAANKIQGLPGSSPYWFVEYRETGPRG